MPEELPQLIVRDLKALDPAAHGRPFTSLLVVKKLAAKTASNGNSFFSLELGGCAAAIYRTPLCLITIISVRPRSVAAPPSNKSWLHPPPDSRTSVGIGMPP